MDNFLKLYAIVLMLAYLAINVYGIHKLVAKEPGIADLIMARGKG
jgi:hypothetical protein